MGLSSFGQTLAGLASWVIVSTSATARGAEVKLALAKLTFSLPGKWTVHQVRGDKPLDEAVRDYPTVPALSLRVDRVAQSDGCASTLARAAERLPGARRVEAPQYLPTGFEPVTLELSGDEKTAPSTTAVYACAPLGAGHLRVLVGYRGPAFHADAPFVVRSALDAIWRAAGGGAVATDLPPAAVLPPQPQVSQPDTTTSDEDDGEGGKSWVPKIELELGATQLSPDVGQAAVGGTLGAALSFELLRYRWVGLYAQAAGLAGYDDSSRWAGDAHGGLALSLAPVGFLSLAGFGGGGWDSIDGTDDPAAFSLSSAGYWHYGGRLAIYPGGDVSLLGAIARVHRADGPATVETRVRAGLGYWVDPFGLRAMFTFRDYEIAQTLGGLLGVVF